MIKASAGGGGKGIRKVFNRSEVGDAFHQVVNEVKGSPVFIMKLVEKCRYGHDYIGCFFMDMIILDAFFQASRSSNNQ